LLLRQLVTRLALPAVTASRARCSRSGSTAWIGCFCYRRSGAISADHEAGIRALSLERLEALAEALLDFNSPADLVAWLAVG
jgi:hypothetical protein